MSRQIFVNLPVKNLDKAKEFFTRLGFAFNPKFTDGSAACMIIGENIFAMLLAEKFFAQFIPGLEIADTKRSKEVINAICVGTRDEVDEMIRKSSAAGGKEFREPQDHGWMYARAFEDLDGHIWEAFHMDESRMPEEMKKRDKE